MEDLQIVCHTTMSERERLPTLKENRKLIKLKDVINGISDELLEEEELDITDINNFMYAAATIMTQRVNQPSKQLDISRELIIYKITGLKHSQLPTGMLQKTSMQ